jgi:hypothetical protein
VEAEEKKKKVEAAPPRIVEPAVKKIAVEAEEAKKKKETVEAEESKKKKEAVEAEEARKKLEPVEPSFAEKIAKERTARLDAVLVSAMDAMSEGITKSIGAEAFQEGVRALVDRAPAPVFDRLITLLERGDLPGVLTLLGRTDEAIVKEAEAKEAKTRADRLQKTIEAAVEGAVLPSGFHAFARPTHISFVYRGYYSHIDCVTIPPATLPERLRTEIESFTKRIDDRVREEEAKKKKALEELLGKAVEVALKTVARPPEMIATVEGTTIVLQYRGRTVRFDTTGLEPTNITDNFRAEVEALQKSFDHTEVLAKFGGLIRERIEMIRKAGALRITPLLRDGFLERMQVAVAGLNKLLEEAEKIDPGFVYPFDDFVTMGTVRLVVSMDRSTRRVTAREFDRSRFFGSRPEDEARNKVIAEAVGSPFTDEGTELRTSLFFGDDESLKLFRNMVSTDPNRTQEGCRIGQDESRPNTFFFEIPAPGGGVERWYISNLAATYRRRASDADDSTSEFTISRMGPDGVPDFSMAVPLQRNAVFDMTFNRTPHPTEAGRFMMLLGGFALKPNWSETIRKGAALARAERENEDRDEAGVRDFDLPRDQEIAFLAFHQQNVTDPAFRGVREHFTGLATILNARGYRIALPSGRRFDELGRVVNDAGTPSMVHTVIDRDPAAIIREQLQGVRKRGIRNVYMELACHGGEDGGFMFMKTGGGYETLSYKQLMEIFRSPDFQDMHFTVSTGACYGGFGTEAESFQKTLLDAAGATEGRVTIITQAKPYIYNVGGGFQDALRYYLAAGLNFGQAVRAADRFHRHSSGGTFNPEIRRSSPTRPTYTAEGERPEADLRG